MVVTNIQNYQVIALIHSSEFLMWVTDDRCVEQIFYFDMCPTVVNRFGPLRSRPVEQQVSEIVVGILYLRSSLDLDSVWKTFSFGKTLCSVVLCNSGKTDFLLIEVTLAFRSETGF